MNEERLDQLEKGQEAIKEMVSEVKTALLGSLDGSQTGLIHTLTTLNKQVFQNTTLINAQAEEIAQLKAFRKDVRKAVAIIAFAIPFVFEVGKGLFGLAWDYLKNIGHK